MSPNAYVVRLNEVGLRDIDSVGGKNASLGEMIGQLHSAGIRVPGGFATTTLAYRDFLAQDGLKERIDARLGFRILDIDRWIASSAQNVLFQPLVLCISGF